LLTTAVHLRDLETERVAALGQLGDDPVALGFSFGDEALTLLGRGGTLGRRRALGVVAQTLRLLFGVLDDGGGALVGHRDHALGSLLGIAHDVGRRRLRGARAFRQDPVGRGSDLGRFLLGLAYEFARPPLGPCPNLFGRTLRRPQHSSRLFTQRVEQLLLVEWPRFAQLGLEFGDPLTQLGLTLPESTELVGDSAEIRPNIGLGDTAKRTRERSTRDLVGRHALAGPPLPHVASQCFSALLRGQIARIVAS